MLHQHYRFRDISGQVLGGFIRADGTCWIGLGDCRAQYDNLWAALVAAQGDWRTLIISQPGQLLN